MKAAKGGLTSRRLHVGLSDHGDGFSGALFGLTQERGVLTTVRQIARSPQHPVAIGRDERGELYVVGYEGRIYNLDLEHAAFK